MDQLQEQIRQLQTHYNQMEGQYQAIKYLFEMIGLYPAAIDDESQAQSSLTQTLLDHLGISGVTEQKTAKKVTGRDPLKLK